MFDRQEMQVKKLRLEDNEPDIDVAGLRGIKGPMQYPLHFVDFEMTSVAISFHAGRRPYEQIAFQLSHNVLEVDGTLRHAGESINKEQGSYTNFRFVRALQQALAGENGTIFHYSPNENTILNAIFEQLENFSEPERDERIEFIREFIHSNEGSGESWKGTGKWRTSGIRFLQTSAGVHLETKKRHDGLEKQLFRVVFFKVTSEYPELNILSSCT